MSFFSELRRRKVVRTALLYAALGWGAVEAVSTMGQVFEWPGWLVRALVIGIFLGLPVAIVISWMFDFTPEGFLRDSAAEREGRSAVGGASDRSTATGETAPSRIAVPAPVPATPILGRERAIESASDRIRSGARVLTITGTGGTGKTRFSIELLRELHSEYEHGAAFVSLASVEAADEVMPAVGVSLDIAEAKGRSALNAVATVIGDRRVLLVLDNFEQVLDAAGDVAELVSRCPNLQVIATSRGPLKIGAETELALPPLELPPEGTTAPEDLSIYPAVELFVQRAMKVKADFRLDAANAAEIVAICRRLDGLPLALELAAARIRILEPRALLDRLDHALEVLTSGDRDRPERQRTLRATVSWSYELLDEGEQRLLRRLSAFSEGWSFEAMESVCYDEDTRRDALDELDSLVEKGLVQVAGSEDRYLLLVTIREFAAGLLEEEGEAEDLRQAHARYFLDFCRRVDEGIKGRGQLAAMRRARTDSANVLDALQWLSARADEGDDAALERALLIVGYLNWFWHITGQHLTARDAVDVLLAKAERVGPSLGRALGLSTAGMVSISTGELERGLGEWQRSYEDAKAVGDEFARAQAGMGIGFTRVVLGQLEEARVALEECEKRSEAIGDEFMQGVAIGFLGTIHGVSGDLKGGIALTEKALAIQRRIEDYEGGGVMTSFLAQLRFMEGNVEVAIELYREALVALETVGDRPEIARVHGEMGWAALSVDRVADARRYFLNSLREYDEVGSDRGVGTALMGLAAAEAAEGDADRALVIAAAADVLAARAGVVVVHAMALGVGDEIERLRGTFDDDVLASLTSAGQGMSPAEVVAMIQGARAVAPEMAQ